MFFAGNPTSQGLCAAGQAHFSYRIKHLGEEFRFPFGGMPIDAFEVRVPGLDLTRVSQAGFLPLSGDVAPTAVALDEVNDVVTYSFAAPLINYHQTADTLYLCSPLEAGRIPVRGSSRCQVDACDPPTVEFTGNSWGPMVLDIDVAPAAVDFGDTLLGSTSMQIVTITNVGTGALTLGSVNLAIGSDPAFTVGAAPAPGVLAPSESADVEVRFAPVVGSAVAGTLDIPSDDPDEPVVQVALGGRGVTLEQEAMALLEFFDTADLVSTEGNRRLGMRNLLERAGDFIDRDQAEQACKALADALLRVDGIEPPDSPPIPDFVAGQDAAVLADEIRALRADLGCNPYD